MSTRVDNPQPNQDAWHLIDTAVFMLSFGRELADLASEPQLERLVETELMTVVNEVFDELSSSSGTVRIDNLVVDLGSVRIDGDWDGARECLRGVLRSALNDARSSADAEKDDGLQAHAAAPQALTEFDVLSNFLLHGVLPAGTHVRGGLSMESLVLATISSEPQRLASLVLSGSSGDVVVSRLARQFSDSLLEQVAKAFSPNHADVLVGLTRELRQFTIRRGLGSVWQGEVRPALWSRLLTNLAAASLPQVDRVARKAVEESAHFLGLTFSELSHQLSYQVAESGEPGAQTWRVSSKVTSSLSDIADLVAGLEQGRLDAVRTVLDKLRSRDLTLAVLSDRLSVAGHRRLVARILEVTSPETEETLELGKAIESYARRSGSDQTFYRRVLERLVDGDLIDLEAISAQIQVAQRQGMDTGELRNQLRQRSGERVSSASNGVEQVRAVPDSEHLFRGYDLHYRLAQHLGEEVVPAAHGSTVLSGVVDELVRDHPDQLHRIFLQLRNGALDRSWIWQFSGEELRALVHAFLSLPTASAQVERSLLVRSIDEHAERAGSAQAFYEQVLERLVDGEIIDLEAIGSASRIGRHHDAPESFVEQHPAEDSALRVPATQQLYGASSGEDTSKVERTLEAYLRQGTHVPDVGRQRLMDGAEHLLRQAPERAGNLMQKSLVDNEALTRLLELLPERLLARALYVLGPVVHARVQRYADAVASAFEGLETGINSVRIDALKWQFCFRYLLSVGNKADLGELVHGLVDYLVLHARGKDAGELRGRVGERLAAPDHQALRDVGLQAARILAFEDPGELPAALESEADYPPVTDTKQNLEVLQQGIRITNAGQVIAAPYLPRLFGMLDLLEAGSFKSPEAGERAVHLLQFMVDESEDAAEYDLVLNKVLCGLDTVTPISRGIAVTAAEKAAIVDLLGAMIQHWKALGKTSVGGFRESFLQRQGTLRLKSSVWHLSVEPKAFDMLLDRIPWSFSTIKHSWMKEVLHVKWR